MVRFRRVDFPGGSINASAKGRTAYLFLEYPVSRKPAMSKRERLWTVLNGGVPDRIPWTPCISPYYLTGHPRHPDITWLEGYLEIGADVLLPQVPLGISWYVDPPEVVSRSERKGDDLFHILETPVGTLTSRWVYTPTSPAIPWPMERFVRSLEDLKIVLWIAEHRVYKPSADYSEFIAMEKRVGDEGFATAWGPSSPFQQLLEGWVGVELFFDLLMNEPEIVEAIMNLWHEQQKKMCELIVESPAQVVIDYENTSTSNSSPWCYERYSKPVLDDYADMIRSAGKVFLCHDCGRLKGLESFMRDGHWHGHIDVARPPTGNFDFARRAELIGDKVIAGGIDATAFTSLGPEEMKEHVREFLREVAPGDHFILGSGDAVPIHTPPEVLKAIGELVAEEAMYPLSL